MTKRSSDICSEEGCKREKTQNELEGTKENENMEIETEENEIIEQERVPEEEMKEEVPNDENRESLEEKEKVPEDGEEGLNKAVPDEEQKVTVDKEPEKEEKVTEEEKVPEDEEKGPNNDEEDVKGDELSGKEEKLLEDEIEEENKLEDEKENEKIVEQKEEKIDETATVEVEKDERNPDDAVDSIEVGKEEENDVAMVKINDSEQGKPQKLEEGEQEGGENIPDNLPFTKSEVIPSLFSTGISDEGELLPFGAIDSHYVLSSIGGLLVSQPLMRNWLGSWSRDDEKSGWLGGSYNFYGIYGARSTFDLTNFQIDTVVLKLNIVVSDILTDILLNGVSKVSQPLNNNTFETEHIISNGFVSGINTIEFKWTNRSKVFGIRVLMIGVGVPLI